MRHANPHPRPHLRKRSCFLLLLVCLLLASPISAQQRGVKQTVVEKASGEARNRALIIGNNEYLHWPPLKTAVHDAEALASLLTSKYGYPAHEVRLLRNATRIQMLDGIDWLQQTSGPDDHVLIYYAGHGEYDKNEDGWWVPVDGELRKRHQHISNSDVLNKLRAVKARHKLLISDSCFSGNLFTRGIKRTSEEMPTQPRWIRERSQLKSVWGLSSGGNEPVSDGGPKWEGHSIFAYHLLAQLEANQKVFLPASELGSRMARLVANDTMAIKGAAQTPAVHPIVNQGHQDGEFFFVRSDLPSVSALMLHLSSGDPAADSQLGDAVNELHHTIQQTARSTLRLKLQPQLEVLQSMEELPEALASSKVGHALVLEVQGKLKKQLTSQWAGLAQLKVRLRHFRLEDGTVREVGRKDFPKSRMPLKTWEEDEEFAARAFMKAGRKLSKHLSRKGLDDFLWSMVAGD